MANVLAGLSGAAGGAASGAPLGPIGAGVGGILGGLSGLFSGGDDDAAKEALENAMKEYEQLGKAPDLSNPIILQGFQQAGLLTPELIQQSNLNADQKTELLESPEGKKNQNYALNALKDMSATGLTATDRAAYNKLRNQTASDTQAKTNQILQDQAMRGQASSGNALAAQLMANQGASQEASAQADRLAAQATEARQSALGKFADMSGSMRNTDLGVQKFNTENELARQKFLDQNSLSRQAANVAAKNAANETNLNRQQGTSDKNVAMQNQELYRQADAKRQSWLDNLNLANAKAGVYKAQAGQASSDAANQAQNDANRTAGIVGAVGSAAKTDWSKVFGGTGTGSSGTPQSDALNAFKIDPTKTLNASRFAGGGEVGSDIGKVPTDTEENDVIPAALSEGEIVIPKSFAHDSDLSKAYINFIHKQKKEDGKK